MTKIGVLSDTHGYLDPKLFEYFKDVDEIWHAGDVGDVNVIDQLRSFKPTRGVYGNIDSTDVRAEFPEFERFKIEDIDVLMTHIAGKPGKYAKRVHEELKKNTPQLFVCGHSHILLVKQDPLFNMLWMNPGACGYKGFHQIKTVLRFCISKDRISDLEVIELGKRI